MLKRLALRFKSLIIHNPLAIVLFVITAFICFKNYSPGTYLTGWDTLHPEFNYRIYWSRILGGVWQEHQGLGAVATQAHASEITRIPLLMFIDLFLPTNMVRYAYTFLMLILGPLGVYYFAKTILTKRFSKSASEVGSFFAGLVYLLNLGTLQHFYVPLEMFLTHYGYLGWIFAFGTLYFEKKERRNLLIFAGLNLLAASQAHTATLFYAYFGGIVVYFGTLLLISVFEDQFKQSFGVFLHIIFYLIFVNLFWLLPNVYFVLNHAQEVGESKIHHLFSQEAFLQNKKFGTVADTALLKNFLFNWGEHIGNGQFGDLLDEWSFHLARPYVSAIGYSIYFLALMGLSVGIYKRDKYVLSIGMLGLMAAFFLLNVNPPFGFIFIFLQKYVPFFGEAFRFPFTKFSILLMLCYGGLFGYFVSWLYSLFDKLKFNILRIFVKVLFVLSLSFCISYYMLPAFNGYFISPSMKVKIPNRYFDMFKYFDGQKEYGRVANLPIPTFWGWVYHNWGSNQSGYQGAGFLWFGIKQPLLDREFDRWNITNENYYREMVKAVYSQDLPAFEAVFSKYKVKWVLFDKSVLLPGNDPNELYLSQIQTLLEASNNIVLEKDFGDGLLVYKYAPSHQYSQKEITSEYVLSNDHSFKEHTDPAYDYFNTYAQTGEQVFPFVGINDYDEKVSAASISADDKFIHLQMPKESNIKLVDNYEGDIELLVESKNYNGNHVIQGYDTNRQYLIFELLVPAIYTHVGFGNALVDVSHAAQYIQASTSDLSNATFYTKTYDAQAIPIKNVALDVCSDVNANASYTLTRTNTGFSLSSKSAIACVNIKLADFVSAIKSNEILLLNFVFDNDSRKPSICIYDNYTGVCVNNTVDASTVYALLEGNDVSRYDLHISVSGILSKTEVSIDFSNIKPTLLTPSTIAKVDVDLNNLNLLTSYIKLAKDPIYSGDISKFALNPRSCKTGERLISGGNTKVVNGVLTYTANDDYICDTIALDNVSHATGLLLQFRSRNLQGLPLRICLSNNESKRCDLYISLPESAEWHDYYYFVPPMDKGRGYTLNFTSLPIGNEPTKNELAYLSVSEVPYSYIKSLVYKDAYDAQKMTADKQQLVVYNQAYEHGWLLFCGLLPCNAQHIAVNNWANGWIMSKAEANLDNVHAIFWPQVLEVIGFLTLPLIFKRKSQ